MVKAAVPNREKAFVSVAAFNSERWNKELPSAAELSRIMDVIGISKDLNTIGVDAECAKLTFKATKDIQDKHVLSRPAWDLGILEELCALL